MTDSKAEKELLLATTEYALSMLKLVRHVGGVWDIQAILDMVIQGHEESVASYKKQLKELEEA